MDTLAATPQDTGAPPAPPVGALDGAVPPEAEPPLSPEQAAARAEAEARAQAEAAAAEEAAQREAQLQLLMERMQKHADFPSLRESIRGIQTIARSEKAHLRALTEEVLGDVALSNKLLRMINTAFYSSVGGGNISSLQRAVALMGFQPVGMLASSLTLFDRLPKGPDGDRVRKEYSRALMAAMLANQFCPVRKLEESAYIAAMFQNLGTMLAWMHFPPEATEIEALVAQSEHKDHEALQMASRQVLGMGYDDLAIEVARQWGWPENLQSNLRRLEPSDPEREATNEEYLRVVCTAANRLAAELEQIDGPEALEAALAAFRTRYGIPLGLGEEELPEMVERARAQWDDLSLVLGIAKLKPPPPKAAPARGGAKAGAAAEPVRKAGGKPAEPAASVRSATPPKAAEPAAPVRRPAAGAAPRNDASVAAALSAAVGALSQRAMSDAPLAEILQLVMNHLREAMALQRVVICLRDTAGGELVGRLGVGDRAMQLAPLFRIPMQPPADLFGLLCAREADTLISDTSDPVIAQRLPAWFRQHVKAPAFVMLPLAMGGKPLGMIYGDHALQNRLAVDENELTLLKALRNQLIMAMRLRGVSG